MGQANSHDDQHLDGPNHNQTTTKGGQQHHTTHNQQQQYQHHAQPPSSSSSSSSRPSSSSTHPISHTSPTPHSLPAAGHLAHRDDSGNDFAMSIADGGGGSVAHTGMSDHIDGSHLHGDALSSPPTLTDPHATILSSPPPVANASPTNLFNSTPGTSSLLPQQPMKIETVPTAFKWVHGGNEVYVTGSFNAWQGKILMYPNDDGEHTLLIDIPPGTHHYKYIVDQEWRLDEDAPTVEISNVWNNVVEVKRPVFEYTPANFADSDEDEVDDRKQKAAYSQRAPLSNDYVNDPPKLPPHMTEILLNQVQPQDPNMLPVPSHVVLNHLYVMQHTDPSVLVTGMTQRFKPNSHTKITHKFVTTVLYSPLNSIDSYLNYQVIIHLPSDGASITLNDLNGQTTVGRIKQLIEEKVGFPVGDQILNIPTRTFTVDDTVMIRAIGESPLVMQLTLRGGGGEM